MSTGDPVAEGFRLIEETIASPPRTALLQSAREEAPRLRSRRRKHARARLALSAGLLAAVVAAALTPPGRAATEWVAELAGIGDPPTLDHPYDEPGAVVLDAGQLPDGTPYEVVARLIDPSSRVPSRERGFSPSEAERPTLRSGFPAVTYLCFGIDLPTDPRAEQDSFCAGHQPGGGTFSTYGAQLTDRDVGLAFGIVEDSRVASVRIVDERSDDLLAPSELLEIPPDLAATVGRDDPPRLFVAAVDRALVASARQHGLRALALDTGAAELGRVVLIHKEPGLEAGNELDRKHGQPAPLEPSERRDYRDELVERVLRERAENAGAADRGDR